MPASYRCLLSPVRATLIEKRSTFYADALPVHSEAEAIDTLDRIRKQEATATHHVYAYVLGGQEDRYYQRFSDDGEPRGTAGKPVLDVLLGAGLRDTLIVVTRYFGGTLLGTGGLVHAYSTSASQALALAQIVEMEAQWTYTVSLPYALADSFRHQLKRQGIRLLSETYAETILFTLSLPAQQEAPLQATLAALTAGQIQAIRGQSHFVPLPTQSSQ